MARSLGEAVLTITTKTQQSIRGMQMLGKNLHHIGSSVSAVGSKMRNFGLLASTALGAIMAPAILFEKNMSRVKALTKNITEGEFTDLNNKAKELGATTVFTAGEVAESMTFLAMAGLTAKEQMISMNDTLNLAQIGNLSLARAADHATNVMSSFEMKAKDLNRIMDVMAVAATSTNTSVEELAQGYRVIAPFAVRTKTSFEEISAALGILANNGLKGSEAGNGLQRIMVRLTKPTKAMTKVFDKLGMNMKELNPDTNSLITIMRKLHEANLLNAQSAEIFGLRGLKFGLSLRGDEARNSMSKLKKEMEQVNGAAQRMADVMKDNVWGALKELKSALEGVSLEIFDILRDSIKSVTEKITAHVRGLIKWIIANKQTVKAFMKLATIVSVFSAVLGTILSVVGTFIIALGGIVTTVSTLLGLLSGSFVPILAVGAALLAMAGVLAVLGNAIWKNRKAIIAFLAEASALEMLEGIWIGLKKVIEDSIKTINKWLDIGKKKFQDFMGSPEVKKFIAQMKDVQKQVVQTVKDLVKKFEEISAKVKEFGDEHIPKAMDAIKKYLIPIIEKVTSLISYLSLEFEKIPWKKIELVIKTAVIPTVEMLMALWGVLSDVIQNFALNTLEYIRGWLEGFIGVWAQFDDVFGELARAWDGLMSVIKEHLGGAESDMLNWQDVMREVGRVVGGIVAFLAVHFVKTLTMIINIITFLLIFWDEMVTAIMDGAVWLAIEFMNLMTSIEKLWMWIQNIPEMIRGAWNKFVKIIVDGIEFISITISAWFVKMINDVGKWLMAMIDGAIKMAVRFWQAITTPFIVGFNWIKAKFHNMVNFMKALVPQMKRAGIAIMTAIWNGMKQVWANFKVWWAEKWQMFKDFLNWRKRHSPSMKDIWEDSMAGLQSVAKKGATAIGGEMRGVHLTPPTMGNSGYGQGNNSSTTLNDNRRVDMNVNTTLDIEEMKRQVGNHFQRQSSMGGNL